MIATSDKETMLERTRQSRAELEAFIVDFDDAQLTGLVSPDGWIIKEIMAQIYNRFKCRCRQEAWA